MGEYRMIEGNMIARFLGVMIAAVIISSSAFSQTLEQQERLNRIDKFMNATDEVLQLTQKMTKEKKLQCMTAIGNETFCECLSQNLPVPINFVQYTAIVTKTKEELGYEKASPDDKKIVDNTRAVRDKCINERR